MIIRLIRYCELFSRITDEEPDLSVLSPFLGNYTVFDRVGFCYYQENSHTFHFRKLIK